MLGAWTRPSEAYAQRSLRLLRILERHERALEAAGADPFGAWEIVADKNMKMAVRGFQEAHLAVGNGVECSRRGRSYLSWAEFDKAARRLRVAAFALNMVSQRR